MRCRAHLLCALTVLVAGGCDTGDASESIVPDAARDLGPDFTFTPIGEPDAAPDMAIPPDMATAPDGPAPDMPAPPDAANDTDAGDAAPPAPDMEPMLPEPPAPLALRFEAVVQDSGALRLTDIVFLPGTDGELLVADKDGEVIHMRLDSGTASASRLGSFGVPAPYNPSDSGLISIALDPAFEETRWVYVGRSLDRETNAIIRYTFDASAYDAIVESGVEIIRVHAEGSPQPWHNIGSIGFTDDGYMWAVFGDKKFREAAQDPMLPLGKALRFTPLPEGGYRPAPDNPFADGSGHPAVWAVGLRSCWKAHFWRDRLFISDVGRDIAEEINMLARGGENFGWGIQEGDVCPDDVDCSGFDRPIAFYHHEVGQWVLDDVDARPNSRRSAWVGAVYRRDAFDRYEGRWNRTILFGDFFLGFVRGVRADDPGETWHVGHLQRLSAMAQGPDGYFYVTTFGTWPIPREGEPRPAGIYRAVLAE